MSPYQQLEALKRDNNQDAESNLNSDQIKFDSDEEYQDWMRRRALR